MIDTRYDGESAMPFSTVKIDWTYDALNRLTLEQRDEGDDGIQNGGDYTDTFAFDLAGNRISRIHDAVGAAQDETVLSTYDGRDRLISADSTHNLNDAIHGYDLNGSTISVTTAAGTTRYVWDLRNRLVGLNADGNLNAFGRDILTDAGDVTFAYDFAGVRIRRSVIGDQATYYLQTQINPTGYSQVLEEWTNPNGTAPARSYVIGLDVLGQLSTGDENQSLLDQKLQWAFEWSPGWRFTMDWDGQAYSGSLTVGGVTYHALATPDGADPSLLDLKIWQGEPVGGTLLVQGQVRFSGQGATVTAWAAEAGYEGYTGGFRFVRTQLAGAQYLLYDGGGHTRGLLDATGQPLTAEIYTYDAYGNRIEDPNNPIVPATNLLYRGEYFDAVLGQYVLRRRYYDPSSGRLFSSDDYLGNTADPLSLHKYLYANANPIYYVDPSGQFSITELNATWGNIANVSRMTVKVVRAYQRATSILDTVTTLQQIFQTIYTGNFLTLLQSHVSDGLKLFGTAFSPSKAIRSLEKNLPKLITRAIPYWSPHLVLYAEKLKGLAIWLPNPGLSAQVVIPSGKIGKLKLSLVAGGKSYYGTIVGMGVDMPGIKGVTNLRQIWRMDFHASHLKRGANNTKPDEIAAWEDGPFHYHIMLP